MSLEGVSLIATTLHHLDAEDMSAEKLCMLLGVAPPPSWPPLFNGPETREWFRGILRENRHSAEQLFFYVIADLSGQKTLAGTAGYKGPAKQNGDIEIGYSIVPEFHRRGYATAAVQLLTARAFANENVQRVMADTLPSLVPSQGVLHKCGFSLAGKSDDPDEGEILHFAVLRPVSYS